MVRYRFSMQLVALSLAAWVLLQTKLTVADNGPETLDQKIARLETENQLLRRKVTWLELLRRGLGRREVVLTVPLSGTGGPPERSNGHLREIEFPANPTKDDVRSYVAKVIAVSSDVRQGVYSVNDGEIQWLAKVGGTNLDVLIEPLVYVPGVDGVPYLLEAIKLVATEEHQGVVLESLATCHWLVEVVVAKGWTKQAAPILLRVLAERSPRLLTDWVRAAAQVARPENYHDLVFQLRSNASPLSVWESIRSLPGMEPLDEVVGEMWRTAHMGRDSWAWHELALVAAHYGHVNALGVVSEDLRSGDVRWWRAFSALTGVGVGRSDVDWAEEAREWFKSNSMRLAFERSRMRYTVSK